MSIAALAAALLLCLAPGVSAWTFDPDHPTRLPLGLDPLNPPDPDPILVPMPVPVPEPNTHWIGEWKLLLVNQCLGFACVWVGASAQNQRACGGYIDAGATIDPDLVGGVFVEAGHGKGVYGGYSSRCYDEGRGMTVDL